MLSRALEILWVVQLDRAWVHDARLVGNSAAFSVGSRILVCSLPVMTRFLTCGFRALNSSTEISASLAARARSMSRVLSIAVKYGSLSMTGRCTAYWDGLATMFFTACSFGT